jgi:hypothetical protein
MGKLSMPSNHNKKWSNAGIMKCSKNSEVVLLSVFELPNYVWLIVDKAELLDLLKGNRFQIDTSVWEKFSPSLLFSLYIVRVFYVFSINDWGF